MEAYERLCLIGKGACGNVYLVKRHDNKKLFALKKIQLDESRKTRTKEAVLQEARILSELKHPHIVAFHDSFFEDLNDLTFLSIIQDYCDGGTLDDRIRDAQKNQEYFPEKQIVDWFLQVAMAVRFLHMKKVLHRDLKTENVFLSKGATICKLGDFGIAKPIRDTTDVTSTCVGTPCYLSPEMCQDIPYSSKADVWALGCILYETCALQPAFDANNLVSLFFKIVKAEFEPIPEMYSADLHDLVATILIKVPEERPSAGGVLRIPFLKNELRQFIEEKQQLLQQVRLPTRQGSRPYSTPTYSYSGLEEVKVADAAQQYKRALSCRPNVGFNSHDKPSSRTGERNIETGRVSTIPEETEDQLLERSKRTLVLEQSDRNVRRIEYHTPNQPPSEHSGSKPEHTEQKSETTEPMLDEKTDVVTERKLEKSLERSLLEKSLKQTAVTKFNTTLDGIAKSNISSELRTRSPVIMEHTKLTLQLEPLEPELPAPYPGELNIELESSTEEGKLSNALQQKTSIDNVCVENKKNKSDLNASPRSEKGGKTLKEAITERAPATTMEKCQPPQRPKTSDNKRRHGSDKSVAKQNDLHRKGGNKITDNITNQNHKQTKERNNRGGSFKNNSKPQNGNVAQKTQDSHKKLKSLNDNTSRTPRNVSDKMSRVNGGNDRVPNISPAGNMATHGVVNSNCAKTTTKEPQEHHQQKQLTSQHSREQILQGAPNLMGPQHHPGGPHNQPTNRPQAPPAGSKRNNTQRLNSEKKNGKRLLDGERGSKPREARRSVGRKGSLDNDYSDDFDEDSEHSDVEEEIPEEISDSIRARKNRSNSCASQNMDCGDLDLLTHTSDLLSTSLSNSEVELDIQIDVSEIPEELPEGKEATDEDLSSEDFEEIEEELDEMVTVARHACDDLDIANVDEETIVDRSGLRSAASRIIQQHCVEAIGEDNYEQWRDSCEKDPNSLQTKRLEKCFGNENLDTLFLMRESIVKSARNH